MHKARCILHHLCHGVGCEYHANGTNHFMAQAESAPSGNTWLEHARNHTHPMSSNAFVQLANMCLLLGVLGHLKHDPEEIVLNTTKLPLGLLVSFVQLVNSLQLGTV